VPAVSSRCSQRRRIASEPFFQNHHRRFNVLRRHRENEAIVAVVMTRGDRHHESARAPNSTSAKLNDRELVRASRVAARSRDASR
jgi:hypothetical protein